MKIRKLQSLVNFQKWVIFLKTVKSLNISIQKICFLNIAVFGDLDDLIGCRWVPDCSRLMRFSLTEGTRYAHHLRYNSVPWKGYERRWSPNGLKVTTDRHSYLWRRIQKCPKTPEAAMWAREIGRCVLNSRGISMEPSG